MAPKHVKNRFHQVMDELDISAATLSREAGVDASIINKWRRGSRAVTPRSNAVNAVCAALLRLDGHRLLQPHLAPYRSANATDAEALAAFLLGQDLPGLAPRSAPATAPQSGEYTVEHVVYLGQRGFRKAAIAMLDYVLLLPPGQTITVLCHGRWDWFIKNVPFALQFILKLKQAVGHGTRLRMVNRVGYSMADVSAFAGHWLLAHLKGYIRSLYYEGEMPRDIRFVGSIPGYWSARVEEDATVEDQLYVGLYTDPRETRRDAAMCDEYIAVSRPASQYAFFAHPAGGACFEGFAGEAGFEESVRLWDDGPLPAWQKAGAVQPDGSFYAICRVPGIGIATRHEALAVAGEDGLPALPAYLLRENSSFAVGPHKIILCREDVREGLGKARRMHEVLSAVLHRRAFVPREMLAAQIKRLLAAMEERDDFEVALMPRTAFEKLEQELVCYKNSITIGWLQNMQQSVYCNDEATAGSFYGFIGHTWQKLQVGWRRQSTVARTLRRWLAGKDLDVQEHDSPQVQNWDVLPKG